MKFKVERSFSAKVIFEASIAIGDYSYLMIYGKHVNGYFCSVPGWKWGCEMAAPNEVAYNRNQLIDCGTNDYVAQALAEAIQNIASNTKDNYEI